MTDAERYQRDYDRMIQEVEEKAALAQGTKNAETFQLLVSAANGVGISTAEAILAIETHPEGYTAGAMGLIEEIRRRRAMRELTAEQNQHNTATNRMIARR